MPRLCSGLLLLDALNGGSRSAFAGNDDLALINPW